MVDKECNVDCKRGYPDLLMLLELERQSRAADPRVLLLPKAKDAHLFIHKDDAKLASLWRIDVSYDVPQIHEWIEYTVQQVLGSVASEQKTENESTSVYCTSI